MVDRRHLLLLAALTGGAFALPGLIGCSSGATAGLAKSAVAREPAGPLSTSRLDQVGAALLDALPAGNKVLSPFSVAVVLAMVRNGALGQTGSQIDTVLGGQLNAELNTTLQALAAANGRDELQLTVANAVWAQRDYAWKQPFLDTLARWYGAGVDQVDFLASSSEVVKAINAWANQATAGLIPTIVDDSMITPSTRLAVGNAVHFKGPWQSQFTKELTTTTPFTTGSGTIVQAELMRDGQFVRWSSNEAWSGVVLPFKNQDFGMALILPAPGRTASSLTELTATQSLAALVAAPVQQVALGVPRWKARTNVQLATTLARLGMPLAFDAGQADFTGMTEQEKLFLGFVVHEATVTVDETGAEAAAVTVVGVRATGAPAQQQQLILDRPFYWSILHLPTATPLFLGHVDDPTAK